MTDLHDKVVFITGASSGIGEASARLLAKKGAIVVLCGRNKEKLQKIHREIAENGGKCTIAAVDVRSFDKLNEEITNTAEIYGRLDYLINCAGVMLLSAVREAKIDEWNQMIDINVKGTLYSVSSALPIMRKQKEGMIINVISTAAYRVMENSAIYSATKYAIRAFSEGLRKEETNNGIRVCLIAPGPTKTNLLSHITATEIKDSLSMYVDAHGMSPKMVAETIAFQMIVDEDASVDELILSPSRKGL